MAGKPYEAHPIVQFVRKLPGELYLRREAANLLGRHPTALDNAGQADPALGPSFSIDYGGVPLLLYTAGDLAALEIHFQGQRSGRPRLWTMTESIDRRRRSEAARYRDRVAARLRAEGRHEEAAEITAVAATIRADLLAQRATRERSKRAKMRPAA